jgi:hypothetical protein
MIRPRESLVLYILKNNILSSGDPPTQDSENDVILADAHTVNMDCELAWKICAIADSYWSLHLILIPS